MKKDTEVERRKSKFKEKTAVMRLCLSLSCPPTSECKPLKMFSCWRLPSAQPVRHWPLQKDHCTSAAVDHERMLSLIKARVQHEAGIKSCSSSLCFLFFDEVDCSGRCCLLLLTEASAGWETQSWLWDTAGNLFRVYHELKVSPDDVPWKCGSRWGENRETIGCNYTIKAGSWEWEANCEATHMVANGCAVKSLKSSW